ncbi:hypothetical protein [Simplicispira psychrophila]|uniref:hypothetical protein n=1 Tax=Simplicispira psychrophila TaxID=80882 RepID=UPI0004824AD9|nr:hypothetical protein [Simplicispira psychrophila]
MISTIFPIPVPLSADFAAAHYRPQSALISRVQAIQRPLPYLEAGTGGLTIEPFIRQNMGYQPYVVLVPTQPVEAMPYTKLMAQVKAGFGRTMSRLPEVFGVSRQTLYNWLDGETPKPAHHERLTELAEAAQVFAELGIKPTTAMLDRTVVQGKSFLQLLANGADGKETAKQLIRIVQRASDSRAKLDNLLAGRKEKTTAADFGAAALDETV